MAPLPDATQMSLPSVTGEGDDILCFILMLLPWSYWRRQSSRPVARSRQRSRISWPPGPRPPAGLGRAFLPGAGGGGGGVLPGTSTDGVLRKMRSPQTVGVEPLHAGISCFHFTFSVVDQVSGRLRASGAVPLPRGPRQPGQSPAKAGARSARPRRSDAGRERRARAREGRMGSGATPARGVPGAAADTGGHASVVVERAAAAEGKSL